MKILILSHFQLSSYRHSALRDLVGKFVSPCLSRSILHGENCVDVHAPLNMTRLDDRVWIERNRGQYGMVLIHAGQPGPFRTEITPLDIYGLATLLTMKGSLFTFSVKDSSLRFTNPKQKDSPLNKPLVLKELQSLFLWAPAGKPKPHFIKRRADKESQWVPILKWMCSQPLHVLVSVVTILPPDILELLYKVSEFSIKTKKGRVVLAKKILGMSGEQPLRLGDVRENTEVCSKIRGLDWNENSCYMDTALHCLLAVPSLLNYYILNVDLAKYPVSVNDVCGYTVESDLFNRGRIQEELRHITASIRGEAKEGSLVPSADKFRLLLRTCKLDINRQFWAGGTQDSGEFIAWLVDRFPVSRGITRSLVYGTNSESKEHPAIDDMTETSEHINRRVTPIHPVSRFTLIAELEKRGRTMKPIPMSYFVSEIDDSGTLDRPFETSDGESFSRRVNVRQLIQSPGAIIFTIMRGGSGFGHRGGKWLKVPIEPVPSIKLVSGQVFRFSSVVVYTGAHYNCYFLCNKKWYFYDDITSRSARLVGSYKNLMRAAGRRIRTSGTIFFYNQIKGPRSLPYVPSKPALGEWQDVPPKRPFQVCEDLEMDDCKEAERCSWNPENDQCQGIDLQGQFIHGFGAEEFIFSDSDIDVDTEGDSDEDADEDEDAATVSVHEDDGFSIGPTLGEDEQIRRRMIDAEEKGEIISLLDDDTNQYKEQEELTKKQMDKKVKVRVKEEPTEDISEGKGFFFPGGARAKRDYDARTQMYIQLHQLANEQRRMKKEMKEKDFEQRKFRRTMLGKLGELKHRLHELEEEIDPKKEIDPDVEWLENPETGK